MSDDRSSVSGRDPAWTDIQARLTSASLEALRQQSHAWAPRGAPRDAVRVFEKAMQRAPTPGRRARDMAGEGGARGGDPFGQASADVSDHESAGAFGHESDRESTHGFGHAAAHASHAESDAELGRDADPDTGADDASTDDASYGDPRGWRDDAARGRRESAADRQYGYRRGHHHDRDHETRDTDATACMQDVWSLFATGAIGHTTSAPVTPAAPAPRDIVDDLFALVVALRGDASGTAVIELDLDDHALPGVSIRIAQSDVRLCFTFLCRQNEGFRRLVAHAATMAELLHERLARPVGVAVRRIRDGEGAADDGDAADGGGDVDVDVEAG